MIVQSAAVTGDSLDSRTAAARRYLSTVPMMERMIDETVARMMTLPPGHRERAARLLAARTETLERVMTQELVRHFTTREIDGFRRFSVSSEGRDIVKKLARCLSHMTRRVDGIVRTVIDESAAAEPEPASAPGTRRRPRRPRRKVAPPA